MLQPRKLKKGDTIGLIAPSGALEAGRLEPSIASLENMGLKVKVGESCRLRHGYLAGEDCVRGEDINNMFRDESVDGIFCVRGGYGAQRILGMLDYPMITANSKLFTGFSDITALHIVFNQICGFITYHSPMAGTGFYKGLDEYTMNCFFRNVFYNEPLGKIENPPGDKMLVAKEGRARGMLVGGNLSLLSTSIGTFYEVDTRDKILFIEEVGEEPYKVDRMLTHMRAAGKLAGCAGIIFGSFTSCDASEPEKSLTLEYIIREAVERLDIPVFYNVRCGHGMPTLTFPMGAMVELDTEQESIIFLE